MRQSLVSIIVPAYNAARYLDRLCVSIQAQTYQHFEVLIADDGSSDKTLEVLQRFQGDERFKIISWKENRGVASATLALLSVMQGDYWCYPGADDVLGAEFIKRRIELLEKTPQALMVHGPPECIDENDSPVKSFPLISNVPPQMTGQRALEALLQHNFIGTPSVMVRSSITRLVLPFLASEWKYAQDWYFWLLHFATGFDLVWDPKPVHQYRVHSESLSNTPEKAAIREAEIRLVPLCALSTAAGFSQIAAAQWMRWRQALYDLWLRRAIRLHRENRLDEKWRPIARNAFYPAFRPSCSLRLEIFFRATSLLRTSSKEKRALALQTFPVSGLAQINDPIFR